MKRGARVSLKFACALPGVAQSGRGHLREIVRADGWCIRQSDTRICGATWPASILLEGLPLHPSSASTNLYASLADLQRLVQQPRGRLQLQEKHCQDSRPNPVKQ